MRICFDIRLGTNGDVIESATQTRGLIVRSSNSWPHCLVIVMIQTLTPHPPTPFQAVRNYILVKMSSQKAPRWCPRSFLRNSICGSLHFAACTSTSASAVYEGSRPPEAPEPYFRRVGRPSGARHLDVFRLGWNPDRETAGLPPSNANCATGWGEGEERQISHAWWPLRWGSADLGAATDQSLVRSSSLPDESCQSFVCFVSLVPQVWRLVVFGCFRARSREGAWRER